MSRNVGSDQTPISSASDLNLHCLRRQAFTNTLDKYEAQSIISLRKHAYSNILKILQPKKENVQIKNSDIFLISAQNIDCGYSLEPPRRGGSKGYQQSNFFSKIKKK